eukprot:COSAG04_NODE_15345_length_535_cov_0.706422_1_plen_85_part_10
MPLGIGSFAEEYGWEGKTAEEWRTGITALAQCPNVFLKLGGQTQPHVVSRQRFQASLSASTRVPFLPRSQGQACGYPGTQLPPAA